MDDSTLEVLLQSLKQEDEYPRELATAALWQRWFSQKGEAGNRRLQDAQTLIGEERLDAAEALLSSLVVELPDFAEAWNRRAVFYYLQHLYLQHLPYSSLATLTGLGLSSTCVGPRYRFNLAEN